VGGVITLGDMVMYFQAFQRGLGFLRQVLSGMAGLYEDNLFLANLYEFLDLKPKVKEPDHPRPVPRPLQKGIGWFEDGEELSIGEWQKVALARAFLRESQIIVLDEPTSAMDAKSEYEVFRRIRRLLEGRIAILISHRFSTVRMADRIFAFEKGRISESGTHEQLIKLGGNYAYLFEKQARHYQ
jgi:ABC-type multidrug transport system fused ATPase/permease subunit